MSGFQPFPGDALARCGLNRQHVFDLADLPPAVIATLGDTAPWRQLVLLGHGGKELWERVKAAGIAGEHPIDDFTVRSIERCFAEHLPANRYRIAYPGDAPVGLQQLGALAGWHHAAPFMVGIDPDWGSWYAYRAVVLADTGFCPFPAVDRSNPCSRCVNRPCIAACPAQAMAGGGFSLARCAAYRLQPGSACAFTCQARLACPVGSAHRYDADQLRHTYSISLRTLRAYR
jgi:epoxyqueuosine reductase